MVVQVQSFLSARVFGREQRRGSGRRRFLEALESLQDDAGYVLVDALVASLILGLALIFGLEAGHQARVAADQALEVQRAHTLLAQLLETGPRSFDDSFGASGGFAWEIQTRTTGAESPISICHRQIILTSLKTKRAFQAATLETCPVESAG